MKPLVNYQKNRADIYKMIGFALCSPLGSMIISLFVQPEWNCNLKLGVCSFMALILFFGGVVFIDASITLTYNLDKEIHDQHL